MGSYWHYVADLVGEIPEMKHALKLVLCLCIGLGASTAFAQNDPAYHAKHKSIEAEEPEKEYFKGNPFPQDNNFFVGIGADFFDSFGIQTRYAARLLKHGFIPNVNDSFFFEGGFGMTFYGTHRNEDVIGFNFTFTGRWDFQMDSRWTLFSDLGFGFNAVSGIDHDAVKGGAVFPCVGVGAMFNFNSAWALRGDLSYQFLGFGILHRF